MMNFNRVTLNHDGRGLLLGFAFYGSLTKLGLPDGPWLMQGQYRAALGELPINFVVVAI